MFTESASWSSVPCLSMFRSSSTINSSFTSVSSRCAIIRIVACIAQETQLYVPDRSHDGRLSSSTPTARSCFRDNDRSERTGDCSPNSTAVAPLKSELINILLGLRLFICNGTPPSVTHSRWVTPTGRSSRSDDGPVRPTYTILSTNSH